MHINQDRGNTAHGKTAADLFFQHVCFQLSRNGQRDLAAAGLHGYALMHMSGMDDRLGS